MTMMLHLFDLRVQPVGSARWSSERIPQVVQWRGRIFVQFDRAGWDEFHYREAVVTDLPDEMPR